MLELAQQRFELMNADQVCTVSSTFEEYPKYKSRSEPLRSNPNVSFPFQRAVFDTIMHHVESETP
jgi:hypothetical protein